jgi:hypothetical protein
MTQTTPPKPPPPKPTVREAFLKAIAGNPRWKEAEKTGVAVIIVGAKP